MKPIDYNLTESAYSIPEFSRKCGVGRNAIYNALNSGQLESVHIGGRHLITAPQGAAFLNSLATVPAKKR